MRPQVPPGYRLILTGLRLSQVCSWAGSGLPAYASMLVTLSIINRCLSMAERLGKEGW